MAAKDSKRGEKWALNVSRRDRDLLVQLFHDNNNICPNKKRPTGNVNDAIKGRRRSLH